MRPKIPPKLENCRTLEEFFDTRLINFLLANREPAKNFRKDGSYGGRLNEYFRELKNFCCGNGYEYDESAIYADQKGLEKFFYAFFRGMFKKGSCANKHFVKYGPPDFLLGELVTQSKGKYLVANNDINCLAFKEAFLAALNFKTNKKSVPQAKL